MTRRAHVSGTAQTVALMRSLATADGVLDDEQAASLLAPAWRVVERTLRIAPSSLRRHRSIAYVAARTRFFDDEVVAALDDGVAQVVVLGAGYDTRWWRLARPGVTFFEVDLEVTQADKRRRAPVAPAGGPVYVAGDLVADDLVARLVAAGFDLDSPAIVTLEGVTMYLDHDDLAGALGRLAAGCAAGSRLAVNFGVGFAEGDRAREGVVARLGRRLVTSLREPFRFEPDPAEVPGFLASCGWRVERCLTGPDLASTFLAGTPFAGVALNPGACAVSALRD